MIHTISETAMQQLLRIEMVQQLIEQPKSGSPYFLRPKKHLDIALRLLTQEATVQLVAKSDDELTLCIERIEKHAQQIENDCPDEIILASKKITTLDELITFAKLYYCWIIRKSILSSPMFSNRRTK
ncbi:MAG: hypothetical protein JSR37_08915 [Verrucomicrobia bacterium]|nr:hypothetical protein [Verrucomicrobiota bacterium]MBS0637704.1 hypothetical protein [Verrucomicrobiota bacterium]